MAKLAQGNFQNNDNSVDKPKAPVPSPLGKIQSLK